MQGLIELDLIQYVTDRQRRRRVLMWERVSQAQLFVSGNVMAQ
jgi:hypothetical protein